MTGTTGYLWSGYWERARLYWCVCVCVGGGGRGKGRTSDPGFHLSCLILSAKFIDKKNCNCGQYDE